MNSYHSRELHTYMIMVTIIIIATITKDHTAMYASYEPKSQFMWCDRLFATYVYGELAVPSYAMYH